jgi:hypothetical protein
MLTYDDCLGLCELTPEEVAAIARYEHLPEIAALEMGSWLRRTLQGKQVIRRMILDEVKKACGRGDSEKPAQLQLVLHHFVEGHIGRPAPDNAIRHADGGEDASDAPRTERFQDEDDYSMRTLASTPPQRPGCATASKASSRRCCAILVWTTRMCRSVFRPR